MRKTIPKCPKCSSKQLLVTELWSGMKIAFDQSKDGVLTQSYQSENCDPFMVEAKCEECGKRWKLKGITQISNLPNYTEEL